MSVDGPERLERLADQHRLAHSYLTCRYVLSALNCIGNPRIAFQDREGKGGAHPHTAAYRPGISWGPASSALASTVTYSQAHQLGGNEAEIELANGLDYRLPLLESNGSNAEGQETDDDDGFCA